ncbi:hypothetical protein DL96DRAFT_1574439 [Flagelloscypha sp. PMI_526]|nr:hypothetical protein DL96DRAFT_1574439 [Flagelloscypha sp. PMI_526]
MRTQYTKDHVKSLVGTLVMSLVALLPTIQRLCTWILVDHTEALKQAQSHGSGDSSLFSTALSFITDSKDKHNEPIDEEHVTTAHKSAYDEGKGNDMSAQSIGAAAAMEILKKFTSGSQSSTGSGNSQTQMISMAMAEASKLFDKQKPASGDKQDAVNSAGMTIMKLLVQSKGGSSTTIGGGNSGGLGGLLNLAQAHFGK